MITTTDKELIDSAPDDLLALWWCRLNCWEWPEEIPDPEPVEYRQTHFPHAETRGAQIMHAIEAEIGMKALLRFWNVHYNERMTPEAFNNFINTTGFK